jgi:hypothetical protein
MPDSGGGRRDHWFHRLSGSKEGEIGTSNDLSFSY